MSLQVFRFGREDMDASTEKMMTASRHIAAQVTGWEEGDTYIKHPDRDIKIIMYGEGTTIHCGVELNGRQAERQYTWAFTNGGDNGAARFFITTNSDNGIAVAWGNATDLAHCMTGVAQNTLGDFIGFLCYPNFTIVQENPSQSSAPSYTRAGTLPESTAYCVASLAEYPDLYSESTIRGLYQVLTIPKNTSISSFELEGHLFVCLYFQNASSPIVVMRAD